MNAIVNATLYDFESFHTNQYLIYEDTIRAVGEMTSFPGVDGEMFDAGGMLVLPGFVIAHTHIYSAFARGLSLPFAPKSFQDILDQLWWKIDSRIDREIAYHSGVAFAYEAIKRGVTTIFDHHASGKEILGTLQALQKAVVKDASLRGAFCFETSDRFDVRACISENVAFAQNQSTDTKAYFGLHASSSLSEETLQAVSKQRGTLPIHIHVAESIDDVNDCLIKHQERIATRLDRHGLLDNDALLVHGIHLNESELDLIAKSNARIVVNPHSNANNAVGFPDVVLMRQKGIPVVVGNDGMSAGIASEYLTLYLQSKQFGKHPLAFTLEDLRALILEGYRLASQAFGLPIGKLDVGNAADLQLIDYRPYTTLDETNVFGHLVYGLFDAWRPRHVVAKGKTVMKDYAVFDELARKQAQAIEASKMLWNACLEDGR